jgi:glycine/D-amino acid oxidase-like deaminating enzyme/nitrite reductase/ring-hydroxylating ferredoxin subunit
MPPPTTTTAADADADTRTAGHDRTYWRATAAERSDPPLLGERDADVVVVGAGIVGLSVALLAVEAGLDVVVLEARQLASGTTGGTTGKVTSQNGTRLRELRGRFGADGARRYTQLTEGGIARLDELVDRYAIACDLEVAPAHLVSLIARRDRVVEEEATASREAGLTVTSDGELPEVSFRVRRSLTVPDQRQVHAVKLVHGLADAVTSAGGAVHADSRVVDVDPAGGSRRWRVRTTRGVVTADDVVLATRLPTHRDTRLIFARTKPVSAVGIAGPVHAAAPVGMYLFKGTRDWSIRGSRLSDGGEHLVAVGMSATTGDRQALRQRGDRLHAWTRDRWPLTDLTHVWMAQDQLAADERPLIGRLWADGVWTATGFGKWGLAAGSRRRRPAARRHHRTLRPERRVLRHLTAGSARRVADAAAANLRVSALLVGDHLRAGLRHDLDDLAAGDGRVVRRGRHLVAVSRRDDGALDAVSAHCTHLGCLVRWNRQERTWDCGCHGSRFAPDGEVLDAPATASLDQVPLDD